MIDPTMVPGVRCGVVWCLSPHDVQTLQALQYRFCHSRVVVGGDWRVRPPHYQCSTLLRQSAVFRIRSTCRHVRAKYSTILQYIYYVPVTDHGPGNVWRFILTVVQPRRAPLSSRHFPLLSYSAVRDAITDDNTAAAPRRFFETLQLPANTIDSCSRDRYKRRHVTDRFPGFFSLLSCDNEPTDN